MPSTVLRSDLLGPNGAAKVLPAVTVDQSVVDLARERIAHAYDLFDTVAVSFSGGKDSTVVFQLALEEARRRGQLPLLVTHFDEECIPYETEAYVRRVAQTPDVELRWYCLPVKHRNACSRSSPWWYPWAPEDQERWARPLPPEALTHLAGYDRGERTDGAAHRVSIPDVQGLLYPPAEYGRVATLMGIRAQESLTRRRAVSLRRFENYIVQYPGATDQGNIWKVYPIYDWQTEDVWTAPAHFGWDYNHAYDLMEQAGVQRSQQRCSPAFGEEPLEKLWCFQVAFPDVWERMCDRVPGAATAGRYALTELYSYHGKPQKPPDMGWEDFLLHFIRKFDPASQRKIATRIRRIISRHYKATTDPLAVHAPHPLTGLSWDFLVAQASRGDFKERRQEAMALAGKDREQLWRDYRAERAEMDARGEH